MLILISLVSFLWVFYKIFRNDLIYINKTLNHLIVTKYGKFSKLYQEIRVNLKYYFESTLISRFNYDKESFTRLG